MFKKFPQVRPVHPEFPQYQAGNFGAFFFGALLWLVLTLVFLFSMYVLWFQTSLSQLCQLVHRPKILLPFWVSILITIFFFPVTLVVILLDSLRNIVQAHK